MALFPPRRAPLPRLGLLLAASLLCWSVSAAAEDGELDGFDGDDGFGEGVVGGQGGAQEVVVAMEHSLDGVTWTKAGALTAQRTREGVSNVRLSRLQVRRDGMAKEDSAAFQRLIDNDSLYRVRVPGGVAGAEANGEKPHVLAFVKARCLAHAGMHEHVSLHVDGTGNVVALEYRTPSGQCAPDLAPVKQESWAFARATANVKYPRVVPPLKGSHVQPSEGAQGDAAEEVRLGPDGQPVPKKQKTFFQRNWMFIMPALFLVMNLINPPQEPPKKKRAGGASSSGAAAAAAKKSS